jgi:hypothetical protein
MRATTLAIGLAVLALPAPVRASRTGRVTCCLLVRAPGMAPDPACVPYSFNVRPRRFARKRICRLLGLHAPTRAGCACD